MFIKFTNNSLNPFRNIVRAKYFEGKFLHFSSKICENLKKEKVCEKEYKPLL